MKQEVLGSLGALVAAAGSLSACEERIVQPPIVVRQLADDTPGGACSGDAAPIDRVVPPPACEGRCCPAAAECYSAGNPSAYSGAECLAARDNTDEPRWQLRQTLSVSTRPPGLVAPGIPTVLARRSELKSEACGAPRGASGFIQLIDFDRTTNTSRTGFARYAADAASALAQGLCFVEEPSYTTDHALAALYAPPTGWPKGLPPPMPMPWDVKPVTAARLDDDFDLSKERASVLARFNPDGGDLHGKANGVFYLNESTGYMHGFSPVTYILNYNTATDYVAIPIREAELTQWLNDPAHPNCSGVLLGDNPDLPAECEGDGTNLEWGCPPGNCRPGELASTQVEGYFLIAELEQVFTLDQTLCNLFAAGAYPDWTIDSTKACRSDPKWNPLDSVKGLPRGDWCATTNDEGGEACHDAWKSVSFSTFQAFPIRDGACGAL